MTSAAIEHMTGLVLTSPVAMRMLEALRTASLSRQPIGRIAVVVTPETAFLASRAELVNDWHVDGLHNFASALARRSARATDLLLIAIGDDGPRFRTVSISLLRAIFSKPLTAGNAGIAKDGAWPH